MAKSLIDEEEVTESVVVSERRQAIVGDENFICIRFFCTFLYACQFLYQAVSDWKEIKEGRGRADEYIPSGIPNEQKEIKELLQPGCSLAAAAAATEHIYTAVEMLLQNEWRGSICTQVYIGYKFGFRHKFTLGTSLHSCSMGERVGEQKHPQSLLLSPDSSKFKIRSLKFKILLTEKVFKKIVCCKSS